MMTGGAVIIEVFTTFLLLAYILTIKLKNSFLIDENSLQINVRESI